MPLPILLSIPAGISMEVVDLDLCTMAFNMAKVRYLVYSDVHSMRHLTYIVERGVCESGA